MDAGGDLVPAVDLLRPIGQPELHEDEALRLELHRLKDVHVVSQISQLIETKVE